jgi:ribosomal protein L11 methyltransferase
LSESQLNTLYSASRLLSMKNHSSGTTLCKVSVRVAPEAEESVVELLSSVLGQPASVYADTEKQTTTVSIYTEKLSREQRLQLRAGLRAIRAAGLDLGPGRISTSRVRRENWAESWKRHFKPLEISSRLVVLPSWSKRRAKRGQTIVILDPGLSFGTGHHPTTAFCLEQIAELRDASRAQSLLDVGCGSGILSIAAAKLGYAPVVAFDFDPEAVRVANDNAAVNQVQFSLSRQDLTKLPVRSSDAGRFNVLCANLIYDLLIDERRKLVGRLARDGTLVLAGILTKQFLQVRRAYEEVGLRLVASRAAKEWRSGAFRY